jgi:hypothetical protein
MEFRFGCLLTHDGWKGRGFSPEAAPLSPEDYRMLYDDNDPDKVDHDLATLDGWRAELKDVKSKLCPENLAVLKAFVRLDQNERMEVLFLFLIKLSAIAIQTRQNLLHLTMAFVASIAKPEDMKDIMEKMKGAADAPGTKH